MVFFAVFDTTRLYDTYNISIILYILRRWTTLSPIQSSDITLNRSVSIPYPTIAVPVSTPVATYSKPHHIPDLIPNDIFKRIKTDTISVWTAVALIILVDILICVN